ncbi:aminopeptidase M1-like protein isoform X1 [Tanacetum coccineum]
MNEDKDWLGCFEVGRDEDGNPKYGLVAPSFLHIEDEMEIALAMESICVFYHISALAYNEESQADSQDKVVPSETVVDKDDETLVLVFDEALGVGDGVLEVKFSGVLNEHMKGFYKGLGESLGIGMAAEIQWVLELRVSI